MTQRMRRGCSAAFVAMLLMAMVWAPSAASGQEGSGPSAEALAKLKEVRQQLRDAEDVDDRFSKEFVSTLDDAAVAKLQFLKRAFRGKVVEGCDLYDLLATLEAVDTRLAEAHAARAGLRVLAIKGARRSARNLVDVLENCANEERIALGRGILALIRALYGQAEDDELSGAELREQSLAVFQNKRRIVEGLKVDGCDLPPFFLTIDAIDREIQIAMTTSITARGSEGEKAKKANKRMREAVKTALTATAELMDLYKTLPCEPPSGDR